MASKLNHTIRHQLTTRFPAKPLLPTLPGISQHDAKSPCDNSSPASRTKLTNRFRCHAVKTAWHQAFPGFSTPRFNGFEHGCQSRLRGVRRDLNPSFSAFWRNDRLRPPFVPRSPSQKGGFFHKKDTQSLERRFVGFVEPSTGALFAFSGQIKGGSPERSNMRKPTRPLARRIDERQPAPYQQRSPEPVFCIENERCCGCPYPAHGIICWHRDGTCLRTDMEEIERRSKYDSSGSQ